MNDIAAQYKKLPKWAQVGMPIVLLGLVIYVYLKNKGASTSSGTLTEPAYGNPAVSVGGTTTPDSVSPITVTDPVTPTPTAPDPMADLYARSLAYISSGQHPLQFDNGQTYDPSTPVPNPAPGVVPAAKSQIASAGQITWAQNWVAAAVKKGNKTDVKAAQDIGKQINAGMSAETIMALGGAAKNLRNAESTLNSRMGAATTAASNSPNDSHAGGTPISSKPAQKAAANTKKKK